MLKCAEEVGAYICKAIFKSGRDINEWGRPKHLSGLHDSTIQMHCQGSMIYKKGIVRPSARTEKGCCRKKSYHCGFHWRIHYPLTKRIGYHMTYEIMHIVRKTSHKTAHYGIYTTASYTIWERINLIKLSHKIYI